ERKRSALLLTDAQDRLTIALGGVMQSSASSYRRHGHGLSRSGPEARSQGRHQSPASRAGGAGFHQSYDVAADGRSLLFVSPRRATAAGAPQVVWVDNWFKDLANRRTR